MAYPGPNTLTSENERNERPASPGRRRADSSPAPQSRSPTGTNTLALTDSATGSSSATGTVLSQPYSGSIPSIEIQNANTLAALYLTTNATGASATGLFQGSGPSAGPSVGQTIVIQEGGYANTLTLTGGLASTATITVNGGPYASDKLIIGGHTYTFPSLGYLNQCTAGTANCINENPALDFSFSGPQVAASIAAAITANAALCPFAGCFTAGTTAVPGIAVSVTGSVVTVTNNSGAALAWSYTFAGNEATADLALSPPGTIPAGFVNQCTSSTTGTFVVNQTSGAASAAQVNAAINACDAAFPAVGVISTNTVGSNVITVSDTAVGSYSTLTLGTGETATSPCGVP